MLVAEVFVRLSQADSRKSCVQERAMIADPKITVADR